jgi:hypothetical protein
MFTSSSAYRIIFVADMRASVVVDPGTITVAGDEQERGPLGPRIRCPRCGWTPTEKDLWSCACGHAWNTFDTGGVCPACLHQWTATQCLSCHEWSAHSDWYQ